MALGKIAFAFAFGGVACIVMYIINKVKETRQTNQSHQTNSVDIEQDIGPRNIICPFCNKHIQENDPRLACGHRCHRSCYQNRPVKNRKCSYCLDLDKEATTRSTQSSRRSSVSNECCYCKIPIRSVQETSQLNCQHLAHKECYNSLKDIFQCQACNAEKYYKTS